MNKKINLTIRKYSGADARETGLLVSETFKLYNAAEGTPLAVQKYIAKYSKNRPLNELIGEFNSPIFFLAIHNKIIVGMIRGKKNKISNLFVLGKYHKLGIGSTLVHRFEKDAKKQKSEYIHIRASLYAVPFYQKSGYKKTTGVRNFRGLKIQPMKKFF